MNQKIGRLLKLINFSKRDGLAQIPLMLGLLIMAVAVPVATKLLQTEQDTRNKAAHCVNAGGSATSPYTSCCPGLNQVNCRSNGGYNTCDCVEPATKPSATPATRKCGDYKKCGAFGGCITYTGPVVGANDNCPSSTCTTDAACVKTTPTDEPRPTTSMCYYKDCTSAGICSGTFSTTRNSDGSCSKTDKCTTNSQCGAATATPTHASASCSGKTTESTCKAAGPNCVWNGFSGQCNYMSVTPTTISCSGFGSLYSCRYGYECETGSIVGTTQYCGTGLACCKKATPTPTRSASPTPVAGSCSAYKTGYVCVGSVSRYCEVQGDGSKLWVPANEQDCGTLGCNSTTGMCNSKPTATPFKTGCSNDNDCMVPVNGSYNASGCSAGRPNYGGTCKFQRYGMIVDGICCSETRVPTATPFKTGCTNDNDCMLPVNGSYSASGCSAGRPNYGGTCKYVNIVGTIVNGICCSQTRVPTATPASNTCNSLSDTICVSKPVGTDCSSGGISKVCVAQVGGKCSCVNGSYATKTPTPGCFANGRIVSSASQCCSNNAVYQGSSLTCVAGGPTVAPGAICCSGYMTNNCDRCTETGCVRTNITCNVSTKTPTPNKTVTPVKTSTPIKTPTPVTCGMIKTPYVSDPRTICEERNDCMWDYGTGTCKTKTGPTATPGTPKCYCEGACSLSGSCYWSMSNQGSAVKLCSNSYCSKVPSPTSVRVSPTVTTRPGSNPTATPGSGGPGNDPSPTSGAKTPSPTVGVCNGQPKPAEVCTASVLKVRPVCSATKVWDFDEQSCNLANRTEVCGGKQYCCPSAGGSWTTDLSKCTLKCTKCAAFPGSKEKGDANCDGKVDIDDRSIWRTEFTGDGGQGTIKNSWQADFNCDGKIDLDDRSIWRTSFTVSVNGGNN